MNADELARWRHTYGVSQKTLSQYLGIHSMTVSRWEQGGAQIPPYLPLALDALAADFARRYPAVARPV
jgi:DNA-binding transcriptional regulator YiaG